MTALTPLENAARVFADLGFGLGIQFAPEIILNEHIKNVYKLTMPDGVSEIVVLVSAKVQVRAWGLSPIPAVVCHLTTENPHTHTKSPGWVFDKYIDTIGLVYDQDPLYICWVRRPKLETYCRANIQREYTDNLNDAYHLKKVLSLPGPEPYEMMTYRYAVIGKHILKSLAYAQVSGGRKTWETKEDHRKLVTNAGRIP